MLILRCFSIFSERALCISRRRYSCRPRDSCDEPEASSRCEHLQMVKIVKGDDLQLATVAAVAVTLSGNCWLSWRREQETIWIHFLHWFDFDVKRESQANCIKTVNKYESIHNIVQTYTEWHIEWQRQSKNAQWQNAATSLHRPEWRMTPVTPIPIQSFQSFQEASPTTRLWQRRGKKGGFRVGFGWASPCVRLRSGSSFALWGPGSHTNVADTHGVVGTVRTLKNTRLHKYIQICQIQKIFAKIWKKIIASTGPSRTLGFVLWL